MRMTVGGRGEKLSPVDWPPIKAVSSSLTILTTCWPGLSWRCTSIPSARSLTVPVNCLTTLKLTSASSSARRISRIALLMSSSVSVPRARTSDSVACSFSARRSNISLSSLGRADERDPVADGEEHLRAARVRRDVAVELVHDVALEHLPAAERVVGGDQAARRELRQHRLVVADVARLVGVDEAEVDRLVDGRD